MHVLDNPIWSSLVSRHRAFARGDGRVARYPADVAPFLGIADGAGDVDAALDALVAPDESVYLLGARPPLPAGAGARAGLTRWRRWSARRPCPTSTARRSPR